MLLNNKELFNNLSKATAEFKNIPEQAVARDYLICRILELLSKSEFRDRCVFKGGTSLSKCYPNTIERFSEDIDLTYLPFAGESSKSIEKNLKSIEHLLSAGLVVEKVAGERSNRNKSAYLYNERLGRECRIKLEIGSSVRPEPYSLMKIKTYFQEFLTTIENGTDFIDKYGLTEFEINVLNIERTFMDKAFAIKRHTLEGTIESKARHIYDVVKLWEQQDIKAFVADKAAFKEIVHLIKNTDAAYLTGKRVCNSYIPTSMFNYDEWKGKLDRPLLKENYERLHEDLLYTQERQDFAKALKVMDEIGLLFANNDE